LQTSFAAADVGFETPVLNDGKLPCASGSGEVRHAVRAYAAREGRDTGVVRAAARGGEQTQADRPDGREQRQRQAHGHDVDDRAGR
jgi:hypothetical protein